MANVDSYANHSAIQLATDPHFISWVKCPDEAGDLFWKEYLNRYPAQTVVVRKASGFVREMRIVRDTMEENRADEVWNKISEKIQPALIRKMPATFFPRRWWAAAAVLFILATAGYFIWQLNAERELAPASAGKPPLENDIDPGGNRAILTLADGTEVVLDTAGNGALTTQGDVTVIKLDGQLAYNRKGGSGSEVLYNTITTPKGGQYQLVLADGTRVWLNAASSLRYPTSFTGPERRVDITGEAYFEVAKNAAMPFKVNVDGKGEVEVLGTHFNINAYRDEQAVNTTLLEGSIRFTGLENKNPVTIVPGQQVALDADGKLKINKNPDLESVIAWKNGSFHFNSQDIESIMRQIARWYDVEVVYSGTISRETFSGIVSRKSKVSEILTLMEDSGIQFKIEGKRIIVRF